MARTPSSGSEEANQEVARLTSLDGKTVEKGTCTSLDGNHTLTFCDEKEEKAPPTTFDVPDAKNGETAEDKLNAVRRRVPVLKAAIADLDAAIQKLSCDDEEASNVKKHFATFYACIAPSYQRKVPVDSLE